MKVCSVDGCEKTHRARGLCSTHYNERHQPERHKKVTVPCTYCGIDCVKEAGIRRGYRPYCSYPCRDADRARLAAVRIPADHPSQWWFGVSCRVPATHPSRLERVARFIDGTCADCGTRYITDRSVGGEHAGTYCSTRCRDRLSRRRRRARERGRGEIFRWVDVIGIWLAMGKRCAYCDLEMTEQPDPDHVVPLSRGGHNDIANILPCCHRCNSDKNDMTLGEWAADRARRGKDPRITDYATFDPRAPHLVLREAVGAPHRAAA